MGSSVNVNGEYQQRFLGQRKGAWIALINSQAVQVLKQLALTQGWCFGLGFNFLIKLYIDCCFSGPHNLFQLQRILV